MNHHLIILLILVFIGLLMLVFGYLLKFKQKINIVAGIKDPDNQITDKKKFTSRVGWGVIFIGAALCLMGILRYYCPHSAQLIETIGLTAILICGVLIYLTAKKYIKKDPSHN